MKAIKELVSRIQPRCILGRTSTNTWGRVFQQEGLGLIVLKAKILWPRASVLEMFMYNQSGFIGWCSDSDSRRSPQVGSRLDRRQWLTHWYLKQWFEGRMRLSRPQTLGLASLTFHWPFLLRCRIHCWVFSLSRLPLVNITGEFQPNSKVRKREPTASRTGPAQSWSGPKSYHLVKSNTHCIVTCLILALGRNGS